MGCYSLAAKKRGLGQHIMDIPWIVWSPSGNEVRLTP